MLVCLVFLFAPRPYFYFSNKVFTFLKVNNKAYSYICNLKPPVPNFAAEAKLLSAEYQQQQDYWYKLWENNAVF